ncbi:hypothetical protein MOQ72_22445 [Saccharopolyspora sp. K220]|uniref:hypothetical protein n=1 Tax=Saccharopolyspora soli TaxID=2926618 RepID=UPI001F56727D|nr:hypothetical protein [Saccharopolyspora soli]MCI2420208.1 hypothetical protein [Saccharopolyspora soli]
MPADLARRITMPLFKCGLAILLLLGIIVVGAQAIGVLTGNAALVSGVVDGLGKAMTIAAGVTGLLGFAMSYLFKWQQTGED